MSGETIISCRQIGIRPPLADCAQPVGGPRWDSRGTQTKGTAYPRAPPAVPMTATTSLLDGVTRGHGSFAVRVQALAVLLAAAVPLLAAQGRPPQTAGEEPAAPLPPSPQVLVIFSDDSSQSWIRQLTDGFYVAGAEGGPNAPAWYFEYLDAVRFQDARQADHFRTAVREKYRDRRLDLIVPVGSSAIAFATGVREELWPDVPVLFASYAGSVRTDAKAL